VRSSSRIERTIERGKEDGMNGGGFDSRDKEGRVIGDGFAENREKTGNITV